MEKIHQNYEPTDEELDTPPANRKIKDGIFKLLFETPENAAELYYALTDTPCSPDEILIITITTAISGRLKNDLAFVVRNRAMVLGEHMSSPYANMPVRFLMYTGQLYEKWIKMKGEEKLIYGSKLLESIKFSNYNKHQTLLAKNPNNTFV